MTSSTVTSPQWHYLTRGNEIVNYIQQFSVCYRPNWTSERLSRPGWGHCWSASNYTSSIYGQDSSTYSQSLIDTRRYLVDHVSELHACTVKNRWCNLEYGSMIERYAPYVTMNWLIHFTSPGVTTVRVIYRRSVTYLRSTPTNGLRFTVPAVFPGGHPSKY